jgi:hypothetical protein
MNMDPIEKKREVEQWLDEALHDYGMIEPRAGLEGRVLASLHAEDIRLASQRRWWWALGTAVALATIVMAVWMGESSRERNLQSAAKTSPTAHREERESVPPDTVAKIVRSTKQGLTRPADRPRGMAMPRTPKLDHFPSQAPMSEQERLLARYVQTFPEKAALVARVQTELFQQDERDMAAPWPSTNSINRNDRNK